jgi:hypothetical protein
MCPLQRLQRPSRIGTKGNDRGFYLTSKRGPASKSIFQNACSDRNVAPLMSIVPGKSETIMMRSYDRYFRVMQNEVFAEGRFESHPSNIFIRHVTLHFLRIQNSMRNPLISVKANDAWAKERDNSSLFEYTLTLPVYERCNVRQSRVSTPEESDCSGCIRHL